MFCHSSVIQLISIQLFFGTLLSDRPIVSFNVFQRDDNSPKYAAKLAIPSLHIRAETNLTWNSSRSDNSEEYLIEFKSEEPLNFEAEGRLRASEAATVYDISLISQTLPHLTARSRTSLHQNVNRNTLFQTNAVFEDSLSKMSAQYNCTLILGTICPQITLYHNLTTLPDKSLLYFSSNVTEDCDLDNESSRMAINISLSSVVWYLANAELKQVFDFCQNKGSESMNATHPLMDVSVVADWDRNAKLMHWKKALFESKIKHLIPDFKIEYKKFKELPNQFLISIFKEVPKFYTNLNSREEL